MSLSLTVKTRAPTPSKKLKRSPDSSLNIFRRVTVKIESKLFTTDQAIVLSLLLTQEGVPFFSPGDVLASVIRNFTRAPKADFNLIIGQLFQQLSKSDSSINMKSIFKLPEDSKEREELADLYTEALTSKRALINLAAREQFLSATKVEQKRLFTEDEAIRLANIQTSDGILVFNMDTPNLTYEIIGGFEKLRASGQDFETVILKIERDAATGRFDRIEDRDLRESIVFDQDWFEPEKARHSDMINRLKTQISTKQGIFPCPQCKKSNTDTVELQTRASDEPMTIFNTCRDCGKAWKI